MKRKKFTVLKVTLTAMMLTAALTFGAGSAYAADLPQEGGSEPTVTITVSYTHLYPREVLQQIVDIAREHHLIIFSDEIYDRLVMDGAEHISIASMAPDLFCVTSVSYTHLYLLND